MKYKWPLMILVFILCASFAYADSNIHLKLEGRTLKTEVAPYMENGRVMVPLRDIVEKVGARLEWNESSKTIRVIRDKRDWICRIDQSKSTINGKTVYMDATPKIVNGRTMVPIKFLCEAIGILADWDAGSNTVVMRSATLLENRVAWNTKLYASKSPYIVSNNVIVDRNVTLTIEPGTEIVVDDNGLEVWGKLNCVANASKPIVFRERYSDKPPVIKLTGADNRFQNVLFQVKVSIENTTGDSIVNCVFDTPTTGVNFSNSRNATVDSCRFISGGFGIQGYGASYISIKNSTFKGPSIGVAFASCQNINLWDNDVQNGKIGIYLENTSNSKLSGNNIHNVDGAALWVKGNSKNNDILKNNFYNNDIHLRAEILEKRIAVTNNYWGTNKATEIHKKLVGPSGATSFLFEIQPFASKMYP